MTRRAERGRWANLWWEVLVALLLVCGLVWMAWHTAKPGSSRWVMSTVSSRWAPTALLVAIGAAVTIQLYWPLRRSPAFWGMAVGFLALFGASAYAWFSVAGPGLQVGIWVVAIAAAEFALFAYAVHRKFHFIPKKGR